MPARALRLQLACRLDLGGILGGKNKNAREGIETAGWTAPVARTSPGGKNKNAREGIETLTIDGQLGWGLMPRGKNKNAREGIETGRPS